ncbi:hypothetical protein KOR42_05490 [Thalassoglobus neptunius]|uniref:Secreted protein n=1 Tax=Thalassoglobus neptunius TaxID=1938619 RepID=A0A5C5X4D9_9PLAN|nr:hypothetical protein [Thalassoglobus neptunius]TWT57191.1 hypothetical protein KOR42_05490 [Thalassoglobus neptunius]
MRSLTPASLFVLLAIVMPSMARAQAGQPPVPADVPIQQAGPTVHGSFTVGNSEPLYFYDDQEPWKHGYIKVMPYYGGFHSFRPYNYHHIFSQSSTAQRFQMSPVMPYSQQFWHYYEAMTDLSQGNHEPVFPSIPLNESTQLPPPLPDITPPEPALELEQSYSPEPVQTIEAIQHVEPYPFSHHNRLANKVQFRTPPEHRTRRHPLSRNPSEQVSTENWPEDIERTFRKLNRSPLHSK